MVDPEHKEIQVHGDHPTDHPVSADVFTIPNAAKSLGVSYQSFKQWIQNGHIPKPIITDTNRNLDHYSVGEMEILRRCLVEHWKGYDYLALTHTETIHNIWQQFEAYRRHYV